MAWRRSIFGGGEYRSYIDRGLPLNISVIPRTSVSSSIDLWIWAVGYMFGPMVSVSSEGVRASGREGVVWTEIRLLNAADIDVVCF